ncbi:hypothetical protein IAR55_005370 [Kwoniella newhampshirensis]|uniref:Uncharacterized protein n=1 Tax=Kwoniella newhampshirensis TaxID=1651941 RepID=A0AAW0YW35_9TREE
MCHETPTSQFLGSLITILGTCFTAWHIYCYDKGRCLLFERKSAFRWIIVWMFILVLCFFCIYTVMLTYIKYQEWYVVVNVSDTKTEILPAPYHTWSAYRQSLGSTSYQILAAAFSVSLWINCEETLYWAYLISTIRRRESKSWFQSVQMKIWVGVCLAITIICYGATNIDTTDLLSMERNLIFAGASIAGVLFVGSLWLIAVFPGFIRESQRQGANPDVIARLHYFKELNEMRTLFRCLYVVSLLAVSGDGFTKHTPVNAHPFTLDLFYIAGFFFIFVSNGISLMILLPRNTGNGSGVSSSGGVFVRRPVQDPAHCHLDRGGGGGGGGGRTRARQRAHDDDRMDILPSTPSSSLNSTSKNPYSTSSSPLRSTFKTTRDRERGSPSPWGILNDRLAIGSNNHHHHGGKKVQDDLEMQSTPRGGTFDQQCEGSISKGGGYHDEEEGIGGDEDKHGQNSTISMESITLDAPFAPTGGERILSEDELAAQRDQPGLLNAFRSPADIGAPAPPRDLNIVVVTSTVVEKT